MDPEGKKFGRGPRELTGAVDLINHYKLLPHHEFFCKRELPVAISDTHYLHNVVGETQIYKGPGMELDQLFQNNSLLRETNAHIQPFELAILNEAFQFRDTTRIELSAAEKGIPTTVGTVKNESKDKERKHKKHKDRDKDKDKDKEHKKHKHRRKDRSKDKDKEKKKDKSGHHESGADHSKKHHDKKRKHDGNEELSDVHKHKKSKHKSSKVDEMGAIKYLHILCALMIALDLLVQVSEFSRYFREGPTIQQAETPKGCNYSQGCIITLTVLQMGGSGLLLYYNKDISVHALVPQPINQSDFLSSEF
ncbi:hypothetical protein ACLOJK_005281 [Asimina triloba]